MGNQRNRGFTRSIFFLKNRLFRKRALDYYDCLEEQQYLTAKKIEQINCKKKIDIARFAFEHTRFYRQAWEALGIGPDDLKNPDVFLRIPIVRKDHIRLRFDCFIADTAPPKAYYKATTGGSTGAPISVLHDRRPSLETAAWRMFAWWDIDPADHVAFIYRLRRRFPGRILNALLWWPTRRISLDASLMTADTMQDFFRRYESLKPAMLQGYVGGVYEFALFLRDRGLPITPPRAVWVTSAPLSEAQRAVMQEVFRAPVYDQYGSCEVTWLAAECKEQNGLHINCDLRHIEFVDDEGRPVPDGEWGRILVTDLENRVFPLIRYEIGDMGRRLTHTCPCGINLPLMDKVRGRISDVLRLPNGAIISGEFLTTIFDDHPEAVDTFQILQASDHSITLRCVPGRDQNAKHIIEKTHLDLATKVGDAVPVSLELVEYIPHDRGKTRFIISEVAEGR